MSLDLALNFLKSFSKCLLMCFSIHTLGKIHKMGFRSMSVGKNALFWTILTLFAHFFRFFCLFLQFSTLESCYSRFEISLVYLNAYVYSCCPGKIQNQDLSGGIKTLFWAIFACILRIFAFFFSFPHWNHVIFGLQLV